MNASDTVETKKEAEELCSIKGVTCDYQAQKNVQAFVHHHFQFTNKMKRHADEAASRLGIIRPMADTEQKQ